MEKEQLKLIGLRIRKERLSLKMSQDDLAEALEMSSKARISEWENGQRMPSPKYMMRLASLFKKLEAELFYELRVDSVQVIDRYHRRVRERKEKESGMGPP